MKSFENENIRPIAILARFETPQGAISNTALYDEPLQKLISAANAGFGGSILDLADTYLRKDRLPSDRPIAFIEVGLGASLLSSKYGVDWVRGDFVESEHPRWPRGTPDQAGVP